MVDRQSIALCRPVQLKPRLLKQSNEAPGLLLTNATLGAIAFIGDALQPQQTPWLSSTTINLASERFSALQNPQRHAVAECGGQSSVFRIYDHHMTLLFSYSRPHLGGDE